METPSLITQQLERDDAPRVYPIELGPDDRDMLLEALRVAMEDAKAQPRPEPLDAVTWDVAHAMFAGLYQRLRYLDARPIEP